jgi:hypothetical protein
MNAISSQYREALQNFEPIEKIGKAIAQSGMFGCQDAHQGLIIALDCYVRGIPPLEYQSRNHMIMGKPSMKYDAMLADFDAIDGCRHAVIEKTPDQASVAFFQTYHDEVIENVFTLTWEEAQKEAFVYEGKEAVILEKLARGEKPPLKAKYATPRSRAIMLFARCVSDAIRSVAPQVSAGRYTPEEIEDMTESPIGTSNAKVVASLAVESAKNEETKADPVKKNGAATKETVAKPEKVEAKVEARSDAKPVSEPVTRVHVSEPITTEQDAKIRRLIVDLKKVGITVAPGIKDILKSKGMESLSDLTIESADCLIRALEKKDLEAWAESQITGHKDAFSKAK